LGALPIKTPLKMMKNCKTGGRLWTGGLLGPNLAVWSNLGLERSHNDGGMNCCLCCRSVRGRDLKKYIKNPFSPYKAKNHFTKENSMKTWAGATL